MRPRAPHALILLALLCGGSAVAQGTPGHGTPGHGMVGEPLAAGANSFTEGQVRERFARMGFSDLRDLRKGDDGVWRGVAAHAGREVRVGMDYRGEIAAE